MDSQKLADKLKTLRIKNNLTQTDVGKAIGVNKSTILRWENGIGTDKIKLPVISALAEIYHVSPVYLMDIKKPLTFTRRA